MLLLTCYMIPERCTVCVPSPVCSSKKNHQPCHIVFHCCSTTNQYYLDLNSLKMMDKVQLKLSNMSVKDREKVTLHERRTGRKLFLPKPIQNQQVRDKKSF